MVLPASHTVKAERCGGKAKGCCSASAAVPERSTKMTRVCFLLKVRAEKIEEYRRRHQEVWPEMLAALRATGWHNYSLFLRPDGLLVGYLETLDFEQARARMQEHPINARWQAEMAPFFESLGNGTADTSMMPLEE